MKNYPLPEDGLLGFDIIKENCIIDAPSNRLMWINTENEESELNYRHNNEKTFIKSLVKRVQNLLQ